MEWIFDGIGTAILSGIAGLLIGGVTGYQIGIKATIRQNQKARKKAGESSPAQA